jgi:hypothetical protein
MHWLQFGAWVRENFPAAHKVQSTANAPEKDPASHVVHATAPSWTFVWYPAGQVMHSSFTAAGAYLPAVQISHELELNIKVPAGHAVQWLRSLLLYRPAIQTVQSPSLSCSVASFAYGSPFAFPAGQFRQLDVDVAVAMRPMGHTVQDGDPATSL